MSLVRCEKHDLLYNSKNPRGCLACEQERLGRKSDMSVMQSLARASRASQHVMEPLTAPTFSDKLTVLRLSLPSFSRGRLVPVGSVIVAILLSVLFVTGRPRFIDEVHPISVDIALVRPLTVQPGQPIPTVFAILGPQPPGPHPDARGVARYSYGTGLFVDAMSNSVYSLNIAVASRSWRGLRVGMSELGARGALALLGTVGDGPRTGTNPVIQRSYNVYPSLDQKPTRQLRVEVRPPNGCYDVVAELQPQSIGFLVDGDNRFAVVAESSDLMSSSDLNWLVSEVRVINRRLRGPSGDRAC